MSSTTIDDEWSAYLKGVELPGAEKPVIEELDNALISPECDELYISTKTKILYLNKPVDVATVFWALPIIPYWRAEEGVVKKQMKVVSKTKEEFETYQRNLVGLEYYSEIVLKQIDNPTARRLKFKDERKITVGISKKDILNSRGKQKGAFYNCFAMILRIRPLSTDSFKEIHVKVFNTGKLEIPGVLNNDLLVAIRRQIMTTLTPFYVDTPDGIGFIDADEEKNVLINSNFKCGFRVKREALQKILRTKYGIETAAIDTCSYPGLKSRYYYRCGQPMDQQNGQISTEDNALKIKDLIKSNKYVKVTFMVFQTGSCLIVGKCSEAVLRLVYEFLRKVLAEEYTSIYAKGEEVVAKVKKTKPRKKTVVVTKTYYNERVLHP